ncbi:hypothetical protein R3P38DRAFT_182058 [Favolaschia claudopus]|uniref:Uncharacterized protein n=1 Tax=Favolaschia claudopus TaxID=2862362 RepID=A0AAW0D0U4_9AGAR
MVFRLPTHLDNLIPPPSTQAQSASAARPWRGTLTVRGMRASDPGSNQEIRVTAVETDGDSDVRRWPSQFFAYLARGPPLLQEVRAWIQQHAPPISTFMPDRLPDPDANVVNLTNFRSLSRMLFENQIVAISPWGPDSFPGGGIIIFPAEHSSALLVAALFFSQFPDVITSRLNNPGLSPIVTHAPQHNPYAQQQPMSSSPYASSSRQIASPTSYRPQRSHHSGSLSPIEQPISRSRQEHYRSSALSSRDSHAVAAQQASMIPSPYEEDQQYSIPYSTHPGSQPGRGHGHQPRYPPPPSRGG